MNDPQRRRLIAAATLVAAAVVFLVAWLLANAGPPHPGGPTTSPPSTPARALPAPAQQEFGASVNLLFNGPRVGDGVIAAQLRALRATGATVARTDALWEATEPTAPVAGVHHYDWRFDDRIAGALSAAGLRWLPILDYSAPWAQSIAGQDHSPPRSDAEYAAYAGAFAARYGAGGEFWRAHPQLTSEPVQTIEIWNEPDNGEFWTRTPDAAAYADLYAAARRAVDAAVPAARVIVGGLTRPTEFLPAMLAARPGLAGHIDGVGVHPYGTPPVVAAKLQADRRMLTAAGLGAVALYATEFGWTTSPPGALAYVPAAIRPGYIRQTLDELGGSRCGVATAVLYTWYSPDQNPADSQQWYGINAPTGAPTADSTAFAAGVHSAAAARPATRSCG
ncbi:MAG: hypothetical protein ACR2GZ_05830 [Solirubrobacteraceae bacterium]